MTAAGLVMTAVVLSLLIAQEVLRLSGRGSLLPYALACGVAVWTVLVLVQLADYLG